MEHLIHFIRDLKKVGAIVPSSKFLVKDMAGQLRQDLKDHPRDALRILELGPGTGPLTKELAHSLRPQDTLDVVEINRHFSNIIEKKYSRANVHIHHADILNFDSADQYDYIYSSLPYEIMPEEISKKIWMKKLQLCKENAYICYFKYVSFRKFKSDFEEEIVERYKCNKKIVFRNIPPARLFTLEIDDAQKLPHLPDEQVA
ncbi:MAG: class I SAM-dependent methyltransferase [Balneolaceae bacterium]